MKKLTNKFIKDKLKSLLLNNEKIVDINIFAQNTMANVLTVNTNHIINNYCFCLNKDKNVIELYIDVINCETDFTKEVIKIHI